MITTTTPSADSLAVNGLVDRRVLYRVVNIPFESIREAERQRLLTPTDVRRGSGKQGGGITYTVEDATFALLAMRLSDAYGLPWLTALRLIRDRRVYVDQRTGTLTLTLP